MRKNKGKRLKFLALSVICAVSSSGAGLVTADAAVYWPEGPETESPCVIVMEEETGTVLYEKMADEQHYPASITKIMTALLALENSTMDEIVTFSEDAVYKTEGSGIWRDIGEEMTMEQCLYALMLNSANECAYAIAEHVGGSFDKFVEMMNERAEELGCQNTHFANPHGLTDPDHYTCCRDMALIAREAYKNENFRIITGTARYQIPPTNKHDEVTYLQNHNEMLHPYKSWEYQYEYCTGGKTGWTEAANHTLVTYAEKNGMTLVCVVMNTGSPAQWKDSINLFNYYFDNFQVLNVAENERRYDEEIRNAGALNINADYVKLDREGVIVIPKTAEFAEAEPEITYDSTNEDVVARLSYTFAEREVGGADIVRTGAKIETFHFQSGMSETETENVLSEGSHKKFNIKNILLIVLGVIAAAVLIFLLKEFADNFYIIKHRYFNRENTFRGKKYRTIKDTRKYRHRKRWRKR